jgi:hypothetical protein
MIEITHLDVTSYIENTLFEYKPGQGAVSFPIIQRIHKRLQNGKRFSSIKVIDGIITDGHHRYICSCMLGIDFEITKGGKNPTSEGFEWTSLKVVENDYDSVKDIERYNELYG